MKTPQDKILTFETLPAWRKQLRSAGQSLVVTNGVFDLLHRGHAQYLQEAAAFGDRLLVCINDDEGVRELKGATRPLVAAADRAFLLAALEAVSAVVIFPGKKATRALELAQPDIYVKGGDYTTDSLDREEFALLQQIGSEIRFLPFLENFSTTDLLRRLQADAGASASEQDQARLNFIYARRSIRKYQPRPVESETLRELVRAAMAAPSAYARNPWEFVVVTDKSTLETIAGFLPNGKFLPQAAAAIVICGNQEKALDGELSYLIQDCTAAVQNILLAACKLGLGACWLGVHPRPDRVDKLKNLWQLPPQILPLACLAIGWPAEEKPARTNFREEALHWQKWLAHTAEPKNQ